MNGTVVSATLGERKGLFLWSTLRRVLRCGYRTHAAKPLEEGLHDTVDASEWITVSISISPVLLPPQRTLRLPGYMARSTWRCAPGSGQSRGVSARTTVHRRTDVNGGDHQLDIHVS